MPLTKLARRYHLQKRPQKDQDADTPMKNVKMALDFSTPEPPPYVTVRKKKKPPKPLESLQGTVIECGDYAISDCKSWKRLESTHVDHITESLGYLSILTDDLSVIQERRRSQATTEGNDSFKTALDEVYPYILAEDSDINYSCQVQINDNSIRHISSDEETVEEQEIIKYPPELSSSKLANVADWVINSPFQSPIRKETFVIPVSDESSMINVSEATSKAGGQENVKKVYQNRLNIFGHKISLSSSDNTDHDQSVQIMRSLTETPKETIANIWQLSGM